MGKVKIELGEVIHLSLNDIVTNVEYVRKFLPVSVDEIIDQGKEKGINESALLKALEGILPDGTEISLSEVKMLLGGIKTLAEMFGIRFCEESPKEKALEQKTSRKFHPGRGIINKEAKIKKKVISLPKGLTDEDYICALRETNGSMVAAAKKMGVSQPSVHSKVEKLIKKGLAKKERSGKNLKVVIFYDAGGEIRLHKDPNEPDEGTG